MLISKFHPILREEDGAGLRVTNLFRRLPENGGTGNTQISIEGTFSIPSLMTSTSLYPKSLILLSCIHSSLSF